MQNKTNIPSNYEELVEQLAANLFSVSKRFAVPDSEEKYNNWEDLFLGGILPSNVEYIVTKYRSLATEVIESMREFNIIDSEKWKFNISAGVKSSNFDIDIVDDNATTFDTEVTAKFKAKR